MRHRVMGDVVIVDVDDPVELREVELPLVVDNVDEEALLRIGAMLIEAHRLLRQDEEHLIVDEVVDRRVRRLLRGGDQEVVEAWPGMVPGAVEREDPHIEMRLPLELDQLLAAVVLLGEAEGFDEAGRRCRLENIGRREKSGHRDGDDRRGDRERPAEAPQCRGGRAGEPAGLGDGRRLPVGSLGHEVPFGRI